MRILIFCISLLLAACGGTEQPPKPLIDNAMRSEIEQFRVERGLPGLSVVLTDAAHIETFVTGAVQESDRLEIGSLSKAMTGSLIARLVEQKKLRWDTTLAEVFPAWRETMHPDFRHVTIEQLLLHRSGLPYDFEEADVAALLPSASGDMAADRAMAMRYFLAHPPVHAPGSAYLYSNLGYIVLGLAAEARGGDSYRKLMEREVFAPLQISADVGAPASGSSQRLSGHVFNNGGWQPIQPTPDNSLWLAMTEAAGGVRLSMGDYGRYLREQLIGLDGRPAFLEQVTFERIHSPLPGYGHGWGVARDPQLGRVSQHNGSNGSYFAFAMVMRDQRRALAISCNCYSEKAMADIEAFAGRLASRASRSE